MLDKSAFDKLVWKSKLKFEQKYVLLSLLRIAEEDGFTVHCSKLMLSLMTNLSEKTIQRQLRSLTRLGWIEVVEETKHHLPRVYKIKNPGEKRGL